MIPVFVRTVFRHMRDGKSESATTAVLYPDTPVPHPRNPGTAQLSVQFTAGPLIPAKEAK
jgi:hypothetical protein